jgi:hypothetical protein
MKLIVVYKSGEKIPYLISYCLEIEELENDDIILKYDDKKSITISDYDYYDIFTDIPPTNDIINDLQNFIQILNKGVKNDEI